MLFRYLHCISSVNPKGGGPIEGLRQLAAVNTRLGHQIEVVSLDDPASPWVAECPVKCHALGPGKTAYGYSPRLVPWLRSNRYRFDCVIVNGVWMYNGFAAWRALRGTDTPYFVFTHGMLDPWFKRSYPMKHLKKWLFWPWADYRVLRDARAVFFTSERERQLARQSFWLYRCNEHVVKYGTSGRPSDLTESTEFPELDEVTSIHASREDAKTQRATVDQDDPVNSHGEIVSEKSAITGQPSTCNENEHPFCSIPSILSGNTPLSHPSMRDFLFFGRVHPKKGPDLLIRAVGALTREGVWDAGSMRLVMAGPSDSDYANELKALAVAEGIESSMHWTGMLTGDEKWDAFECAEVFVLPSHQENFGIAVAEALSAGVPVLISNEVNISPEIVADGAGFADEDTVDGTIRLLRQWLALSPEAIAAMRVQARKTFEERYHIEQAAASLIDAFRQFGVEPRRGR
jgi:glycosyltransferase involved in cell wall biosynthesis